MRLADFIYDENGHVFLPPDKTGQAKQGFAYADGAEDYLLKVLSQTKDLTVDSDELSKKIVDWPTKYHLGQGRANILRVLGVSGNQKVLELGSGCGALSRYIGEHCRQADCVEGSYLRARVGRERCRGLNNIRVFCANINELTFEPNYDIVTLIGTWEYAPVYIDQFSPRACRQLLRLAGSALKDDGVLAIAIENKIGLKYWNGWPEDHTDRPYDSIHGYPGKRPLRKRAATFSKREIEKYLDEAGLSYFHFYYCFPDYKFAATIFSDLGKDDELYLHNWVNVPFGDTDSGDKHNIHEGLALRTLSQAGLLREFANSFLIAASKSKTSDLLSPNWIAKRISGFPRLRQYRCVTTLINSREPRTVKESLNDKSVDNSPVPPADAGLLRHRTTNEIWRPGDLFLYDVYETLFSEDFKTSITEIFKQYYAELQRRFGTGKKDEDGYPLMRGECFDFILKNIVKGDSGPAFIDMEWCAAMDLPADYMLYRCIKHDIIKMRCPRAQKLVGNPKRFTTAIIKTFFPRYNGKRYKRNRELDKMLLGKVTET